MKKVLILDDEKELLDLWHWHFKLWGEHVQIFTGLNGAEGIELVKDHSFDLIITDFKMPEVDGISFISQLREKDNKTPIFLFSGNHPELGEKTRTLENVRFFEKPVIGGKLRSAINLCLNNKLIAIEAI